MVQRRFGFHWRLSRNCVEVEFQNGLHARITARLQCHGTPRGSLHTLFRILLAESQNPKTGTITLLRMTLAGHDAIEYFRCCRAYLLSPVEHARGRPLQVLLMRLGAVL